jgi:hypothetical protein
MPFPEQIHNCALFLSCGIIAIIPYGGKKCGTFFRKRSGYIV